MFRGKEIRQGSERLKAWLLDLVYPRTCICCGRLTEFPEELFTCRGCRLGYGIIQPPTCLGCGAPFHGKLAGETLCAECREKPPAFDRARSLFRYRGTGARLIHVLKYEKGTWLKDEIASLLADSEELTDFLENSILVPVPLHARRLRGRGYNQAMVVAEAIQSVIPGTCIVNCLERTRDTPSQTLLSREERYRNMRKAFCCTQQLDGSASFVVIDDVLTTGATLGAAAEALKVAGGSRISAFTLAHG